MWKEEQTRKTNFEVILAREAFKSLDQVKKSLNTDAVRIHRYVELEYT